MKCPVPVPQVVVPEANSAIVHEDDHDEKTLQTDAETAEKVMINEAYTLLSVLTTGKTQIQDMTTDAPLHDESVIAVRDKFLDASDEKVSDEDVCLFPQLDDQKVQQERGRRARL